MCVQTVMMREPRKVSKVWQQILGDLDELRSKVEQLYEESHGKASSGKLH
jgi:hypothetical protein